MKTEQMKIPVILNDKGEPIGIIFYSQSRERIIYLCKKPDEAELIELLECKDKNV